MQRQGTDGRPEPRKNPDRDTTQRLDGQPRADVDEDDVEEPERTPNFLSARELQARGPARSVERDAGRDLPEERSERLERKPRGAADE